MKQHCLLLSLFFALLHQVAIADDAAITASLKKLGLTQIDIQPSPLAGTKTVLTESGVFYVSDDGHYFLQGPLYNINGKMPVNDTNKLLAQKLATLTDEMIIYPAAKEQHVITVFTDIACGYCHKLHEQIADYNALGITVRYLAFPRQGLNSSTGKNMQSIWCVADRKKALDAAMNGEEISPAECNIHLASHYQLGMLYGVQGTPAILLENGMMVPGYQTPKKLKEILDSQKQEG